MKIIESRKMMIIFLCLLINFSNSLEESFFNTRRHKKPYSNSHNHLQWDASDYDFEILDKMIMKMKVEQELMEKNFNSYSKKIEALNECEDDPYTLAKGLKLMMGQFNQAKIQQRDLSTYIKNVNTQLLKGKEEDKIGFRDYKKILHERKKNGVSIVNQLMRQFLLTRETKNTVKNIEKIFETLPDTLPEQKGMAKLLGDVQFQSNGLAGYLKKNNINLAELAKKNNVNVGAYIKELKNKNIDIGSYIPPEKLKLFQGTKKKFRVESENSQFSRLRIQSSYRLEEIVNYLFVDEAQGEDVIRAAIISFLSSIPPHFCWVHDHKLGLPDVICPGNMKRKGSICYETCEDGQSLVGGLCLSNCPESYTDCQMFCSKSNCDNAQDFVLKNFKKIEFLLNPGCPKGYKKNGNLCYPVCEEVGMHTCSDRTCAMDKQFCKTGMPVLESGVLKAFVEYLAHVYTIKSGKNFGWSNPNALEKAKDIMGMKYFFNLPEIKRIIDNAIKISLDKSSKMKHIFDEKVERIASSFFKTKDNTPLALIFKWTDFTEMISTYIKLSVKKFSEGKAGNTNKAENWEVCKMSSFSKNECIKNFQNFMINTFPYYLIDLLGFIAKPICPFNSNYSD